ncbi:hypothetical protein ACEPPN_009286 [Leptodophora sp. 'Broadleaf-Isolate-01']
MQACDRCHARKTRCDRRMPQCTACEKVGAACLHIDKVRQRQLPRGYMDSMEIQLQELGKENQKMRRELATLRSQLADQGRKGQENNENAASNNAISNSHSGAGEAANIVAGYMSPEKTPPGDVVTTEVSYLSLKATGETRYVGSSSGMGLASIIGSLINSENGISLLPIPMDQKEQDGCSTQVNSATVPEASFPPRRIATPFVEAYFQHTHITFPLLHRPSFLQTVELIYGDPDYYDSHAYESFVFDMVLVIGGSNINLFEESVASTTKHYMRAQAKLPKVLGMKGLLPLKAILLLSQHGIFSNFRDTSASIWHLVGIGARLCFEMGLHLEPKPSHGQHKPTSMGTRHVTLEEEMRKRCFWCLYNLDRVVSFTLGRPAAIQDRDIDVSLPSHLDDESFGIDRPFVQESQPGGNLSGNVSPFLHLIRIRRLSGEILATFYSANQDTNISTEEKHVVRRRLHEEITAWRNDTRLLNLAEKQPAEGSYISSFVTTEWYDAVFNNALLLLYRPSPYLPHRPAATGFGDQGGDHGNLFSAAKATITAYSILHRKRRLNYSWITLHGVFIAGLAYLYAVGRATKHGGRNIPIPDYLDVINDTRTCSNVLVAICERWNVARRSCELFNKLSSTVIREAVNAATKGDKVCSDSSNAAPQPRVNQQKQMSSTGSEMNDRNLDPEQYDLLDDMGMFNHAPLVDYMSDLDEFGQYAGAFENNFLGEQFFPSELVTGFSQNWTFDDSFPIQEDSIVQMQESNGSW